MRTRCRRSRTPSTRERRTRRRAARAPRARVGGLPTSEREASWGPPFRLRECERTLLLGPRPGSDPGRGRTATGLAARELEHERRPVRRLGVDEDLAVHSPRQLPGDVEPQAGAAGALGLLWVDAVELLEDRLLL